MLLADELPRKQALDINHSFIVQAPAGSGKTELLTQRFLNLLANVNQVPEEIVAITFTRKAATEMRARIIEALHYAADHPQPEQKHALETWQLAKKALERNKVANWNLLQNPNRLRILTIDSLCARIVKSAPIVANFGSIPNVVENAEPYYRQAAQMLLTSLAEQQTWQSSLENVLLHLDNNYMLVENLFVGMLARRDQWLSHIVIHRNEKDSRKILEQSFKNLIIDTLQKVDASFSTDEKRELIGLASFAGQMVKKIGKSNWIFHCGEKQKFPKPSLDELPVWLGIAELLLTTAFEWRRTVNKNCGFPAASEALNQDEEDLFKNKKDQMLRLLTHFADNHDLKNNLKEILLLPPPVYDETQWEIVDALIQLLPVLVAYLNIIFKQENIIDFIAIASGAIQALGDAENPTDVSLNLDYQIKHLLVDEFQDTSITQYRLLELLTAGWQLGDGRTLFLVGDPMQSIYRFREAEVGIFLRVKNVGLGNIKLTPLTLNVNFRSEPGIVEWCNKTFANIFPKHENIELGAISFSSSSAFSQVAGNDNVNIHPLFNPGELDEGKRIVEIINKELAENHQKSIAVLVRSRSYLQNIVPVLKQANIDFQAIEIEKLIYSQVVQDLFALTRALSHLSDRIAWLSILRAPWCGLKLADLYLIANYKVSNTIFDSLKQYDNVANLSPDAKARIARILPIIESAIHERGSQGYRLWIEYTWYALGGPACLKEEYELKNADAYFLLLENFSTRALIDFNLLEEKLISSFGHSPASNSNVHLMTIHKSKGLEFEVVIIPSLERKPAVDENRLLIWLERQNNQGQADLILAPIKSVEADFDPIYRYVKTHQATKSQHEVTRLLYVALTRARKKIHIVGSLYNDNDHADFKSPSSGSFLNLLWDDLQSYFQQPPEVSNSSNHTSYQMHNLHRLANEWQCPFDPFNKEQKINVGTNHFEWSLSYLHHAGTVIHQYLQKIGDSKSGLNEINITAEKIIWKKKLIQLGVTQSYIDYALQLIEKGVRKMLKDNRVKWLFSKSHLEAQNEFQISLYENNNTHHYIIDRTFIDEGTRWIIDYKTSDLLEEDPTMFLAEAKVRYAQQLENYAKSLSKLEDRPIKLGLYFPLFSGWCEWEFRR